MMRVAVAGKDNGAGQTATTRHADGGRAVCEGATSWQTGDEGAASLSLWTDRHL